MAKPKYTPEEVEALKERAKAGEKLSIAERGAIASASLEAGPPEPKKKVSPPPSPAGSSASAESGPLEGDKPADPGYVAPMPPGGGPPPPPPPPPSGALTGNRPTGGWKVDLTKRTEEAAPTVKSSKPETRPKGFGVAFDPAAELEKMKARKAAKEAAANKAEKPEPPEPPPRDKKPGLNK